MWIFLRCGFYSVVNKKWDDEETLTVRSRVPEDLNRLRERYCPELGEVVEHRDADYLYWAMVDRDAMARAIARAVLDVDYDNFKHAAVRESGSGRGPVYLRVWEDLLSLQRGRRGGGWEDEFDGVLRGW